VSVDTGFKAEEEADFKSSSTGPKKLQLSFGLWLFKRRHSLYPTLDLSVLSLSLV
jgi:hypothetical protein